MNYLFDTNILINIARDKPGYKVIEAMNPDNKIVYVSYANVVEIESIAFQNQWTLKMIKLLENFLDNVRVVEMDNTFLNTYIHIDAYSQRKNPDFESYPFTTPRNMSKHDLWIASTASLLNLQLVTTDKDFGHLHKIFLNLRKVEQSELKALFE